MNTLKQYYVQNIHCLSTILLFSRPFIYTEPRKDSFDDIAIDGQPFPVGCLLYGFLLSFGNGDIDTVIRLCVIAIVRVYPRFAIFSFRQDILHHLIP